MGVRTYLVKGTGLALSEWSAYEIRGGVSDVVWPSSAVFQ